MKLKKTLSAVISAVIALSAPISFYISNRNTGIITASAIDENAAYDTWQEGYHDVLNDFTDDTIFKNMAQNGLYYSFWSKDLNSDGIPELFLSSPQSTMPSDLYTFYDNKIKKLGSFAKGGGVSYCKDENIILASGGSAGYVYYQVYKLQNGELKIIDDLFSDTINKYTRNGTAITKSEYDSLIEYYQSKGFDDFYDDRITLTQTNLHPQVGDIYYDYFFDYYMAWFLSEESTATTVAILEKVNELPVTIISGAFFNYNSTPKTLNLPASIDSFYYHGLSGENLTAINVDSSNPYYASKDGVMYNKDMTELIKFPTAKDSASFTFPKSVTKIGRYAFAWCTGTKSIVIPNTIDTINDYAFYSCPNLSSITIKHHECDIYDDEAKGITICNTYDSTTGKGNYLGVIRGYDDSTAQKYADNFGRTFISLGSSVKEGDCNNDGYVNIADAVMLQRYLLGNGSLTNWKNADLCKDNRIDTFDMVLMRKLLIPPQTQLKGIYAEVETVNGFYFDYDSNQFNSNQVTKLTILNEDTYVDMSKITLKEAYTGADNPRYAFEASDYAYNGMYKLYVYFDDSPLLYQNGRQVSCNAYIGKRGDVNLDGVVNSEDSEIVMSYYMALVDGESTSLCHLSGLTEDDTDLENFIAILADVNGDNVINPSDATIITHYLADGTGNG